MKISPLILLTSTLLAAAVVCIVALNVSRQGNHVSSEVASVAAATVRPASKRAAPIPVQGKTSVMPPFIGANSESDTKHAFDPKAANAPAAFQSQAEPNASSLPSLQSNTRTAAANPGNTISSAPKTLAERAMKVENEANRELERLVPLLHLSEDQQDRVFAKFAQNSVYWNSGLSAPGTTKAPATTPASGGTETAATPVTAPVKSIPDLLTTSDGGEPLLTPDQEKAIVQDDLDRREWWGEVLGIIQTNIAAGTTTTTSAGAAASAVPAVTQPVEGSGTVVD